MDSLERAVVSSRDRLVTSVYGVRRAVAQQVSRATNAAGAVGMLLGMWCGNGDWSKLSPVAQDQAGHRALTALAAALAAAPEPEPAVNGPVPSGIPRAPRRALIRDGRRAAGGGGPVGGAAES